MIRQRSSQRALVLSETPVHPLRAVDAVTEPNWMAAAWFLLGLASLARLVAVFLFPINSDEPQHLHVAWGWAHGLRPYRDVFDNHVPLFHILTAPLFRLLPESADILLAARLAMLPLGFASIALAGILGWRVAGRKGGAWAAVLASVCPPFVLKTVEFRNDTLWCVLVLAAIAVLLMPTSRMRSVVIGVLSALALLTSVKTVIVAIAVVLALLSDRPRRGVPFRREELIRLALGAVGAVLPLLLMASWFWSAGLLGDFLHGAFGYNVLYRPNPARRMTGLLLLPLVVVATWRSAGILRRREREFRLLALTIAYFVIVLLTTWPVITPRDFLPMFPLAAVLIAAWLSESRLRLEAAPLIAVAGILWLFFYGKLLQPKTEQPKPKQARQVIADVLRLTSPSDTVMDLKGETVFRRRSSPIILELVGRDLLRRGVLADTIAADVIRTRTCVAVRDLGFFPADAARFLNANFVDFGSVRVCGKTLPKVAANEEVVFAIAIPARYGLLARKPVAGAVLDGRPFTEPRWLDSGTHTFRASENADGVRIVWENAIRSGG